MMNRKKMEGFKKFIPLNDALNLFNERLKQSNNFEFVKTEDSLGRICFEDIFSKINLPPENRSVVDGYAVRSIDVSGASPTNPIELEVVGKISAGEKLDKRISENQAVEIYTGGIMPEGSDCVVMAEDTKRENNKLIIFKQCYKYQNVSLKGEDFSEGDLVIKKGTLIKAFHIGALVSLNIKEIKVFKKAKIAVISTGSELVNDYNGNGIVDSTRPMIISLIKEFYSEPIDMGIAKDEKNEIIRKISESLKISDMVIITGGTSLGMYDLVPECVQEISKPGIIVHGISIRPARTTGFAFSNNIPILMISGFPVAAYISFNIFIKEFVKKFYGMDLPPAPTVSGRITKRFPNPPGVRSFVRVRVFEKDGEYFVEPLRLTGSGILSTLTKANGIMVIDENSEGYDENAIVTVELTQPLEVIKNAKNIS